MQWQSRHLKKYNHIDSFHNVMSNCHVDGHKYSVVTKLIIIIVISLRCDFYNYNTSSYMTYAIIITVRQKPLYITRSSYIYIYVC